MEKLFTRREFLQGTAVGLARSLLPRWSREIPGINERKKTPLEIEAESAVKEIYNSYLRKVFIGGRELLLRVPFGEVGERFSGQNFFLQAKGSPEAVWEEIEKILAGSYFADYQEQVSLPGRKLILLNLPQKTFQVITGEKEIEKTRANLRSSSTYQVYPYEIKEESESFLTEADVYNFFYLQRIGVDCSGFSFRVLIELARHFGLDLCKELGREWGVKPENVPFYVGTWYYQTEAAQEVSDLTWSLRPGDLILFPHRHKPVGHSAVVLDTDFKKGIIRYLQDTDWVADYRLRGAHFSEISFLPERMDQTLYGGMKSSDEDNENTPWPQWQEFFGPTFESEDCPWGNYDNGFRYRFDRFGGDYRGKIVRLKRITELLSSLEPNFYANEGEETF